jgi:hypothetical protein
VVSLSYKRIQVFQDMLEGGGEPLKSKGYDRATYKQTIQDKGRCIARNKRPHEQLSQIRKSPCPQ